MKRKRVMILVIYLSMLVTNLFGAAAPPTAVRAEGNPRSDALVLVNSASPDYLDFEQYIRPYLDHFGVPYTLVDIATLALPANVGEYALLIIGHRQLDPADAYLDAAEESAISAAVDAGTGLVNFDNRLSADASNPLYTFIDDIFGFGYGGGASGSGVYFPTGVSHYITARHNPNTSQGVGGMTLAGITLPGDVTAIATTSGHPFLAVTAYGAGRAVQWGSYDWMSIGVFGPVRGLDDLVWRSLVWAARKPFVMQGMPPFVTMRVDDESGNFEWIHIANEFGIKPWAGLFFHNIDAAEAADLSALTNAGLATAAIHAFSGSFFYYNHGVGDFSDATVAAHYAEGTAWHQTNNIPIADWVLPHYYEFGTNVFAGLDAWGVEFVGTQMNPGQGYGAPWVMNGPFRKFETGGSSSGLPQYYADYLQIPGHPEFDGKFFNCVTEIRDDAGYEWYPNLSDVAETIARGTRQTKRALDGMALATLFTHGYYVGGAWGSSAPANWRAILQGITDNLSPYEPIYVTVDDACRYIRATHDSNITSSVYDPVSRQLTTVLSTVGKPSTDVATKFYLFMEGESHILVDVPAFSGSTTVEYTLPGSLDHVVVTPNPGSVVAGATLQFQATGYDADNNPIPNLVFEWSASAGGTIRPDGLFTAGVVPGTYPNAVTATRGSISGSATVEVTEPVIDHFEIAAIASPKYAGAPFSITIRARDAANNLVVGYAGSPSLSDTTGTISPTGVGPFTAGAWTGPVTIGIAATGVRITAADGAVSGMSNAFDVQGAPTCPCSIWDAGATPGIAHNADPLALEVGFKFQSATDGLIRGLRIYRSSGNMAATLTGHLWTPGGAQLAEVTIPPVGAVGWQQVSFAEPAPISADTTYIASYYTASGYPVSRPYFTEANRAAFERPPLRALVDGEQGGNGVYAYGPLGTFPNLTYQSSNYWVDVVFDTPPVVDENPPLIVSLSPNDYATGVSVTTDITVQFNEAMDPATITAANFELRGPGDALVPAAVTYESATNTARLNPDSALAYSTSYAALIKGGIGGVTDLAGNPLGADRPWSFITEAPPPPLDHLEISAIASPQVAGEPFAITITAIDAAGNTFTGYAGPADLTASAGTIIPAQTGAFINGVWSGEVEIASAVEIPNLTISVSDGGLSGQSNSFALQLPPPPPPFYSITSPSYEQMEDQAFIVTVSAYPGTTINLWEDDHQEPVLATTTDPATLTPGQPGETDGQWTEFLYTTGRPYPSILAGVNEENYGLPTMRYYAEDIPNGRYQVIANLYDNAPMRYFYGWTPADPKALYIDTPGGATGTQHREYPLGVIQINDGNFNLYVRDADLRPGGQTYPFFGWAWIRLVPVQEEQVINLWEDNHQDPVLATTSSIPALVENDGQWTEFLYTQTRPYPTILAAVNEETFGLPTMHFYASGIPNGHYQVYANLYDNAPMRYFYGWTADDPKALHVDVPGGATGTQHREYLLGALDISDGNFNLYVRDADLLPGGSTYPFFGWAWIRLTSSSITMSSSSTTMVFDGDGDGTFGEPGDNLKQLVNGTFDIPALDTEPGENILITASDAAGHTGSRLYTILSSNTAPTAADDAFTTDEDTPLNVAAPGVLGNDGDPESDPLTAVPVAGPAHGVLALNADGSFTYTPDPGWSGADGFSYKANDGALDSNTATVTITVNPVNDAPTAADDAFTTDADTPLNIAAPGVLGNDGDPDYDPLTAVPVAGPVHGLLALNADGSFTYTPDPGWNGEDSFSYKANDGALDSNTATVTITVWAVEVPALTLTKIANPTIYSYPGQVIEYTFNILNSGEVPLVGPFIVDDNQLGSFQCGTALSLAVGDDITCTRSYTIAAADLNDSYTASITNMAITSGMFGSTPISSNPALAVVSQTAPTAKVTPYGTSCRQFAQGTAGDLIDDLYTVVNGRITNLTPTVFTYYAAITAPAASFQASIRQSNPSGWPALLVRSNGMIVYKANCNVAPFSAEVFPDRVDFRLTNATPGAVYYLLVKFESSNLIGRIVTAPHPTVPYLFITSVNGEPILTSWDSVNIKPRASTNPAGSFGPSTRAKAAAKPVVNRARLTLLKNQAAHLRRR